MKEWAGTGLTHELATPPFPWSSLLPAALLVTLMQRRWFVADTPDGSSPEESEESDTPLVAPPQKLLPTRLVDVWQDNSCTPPHLTGLCLSFDFGIDKTQTWHYKTWHSSKYLSFSFPGKVTLSHYLHTCPDQSIQRVAPPHRESHLYPDINIILLMNYI